MTTDQLQQIVDLGKRATIAGPLAARAIAIDELRHEATRLFPILAQRLIDIGKLCEEAIEYEAGKMVSVADVRKILERP